MPAGSIESMLVFSTLDLQGTKRLLAQVKSQHRQARITLLVPSSLSDDFSATDSIDRLYVYPTRKSIVATALHLIRMLRRERHDLFIILCHDVSNAGHLRDIVLFSFFVGCRKRTLLDQNLTWKELRISHQLVAFLQRVSISASVVFAKILTLITVSICLAILRFSRGSFAKATDRGAGNVAVLLPVLPDLSHTFIYREVLAMRKDGAQFKIFALAEGDRGILHPEARALLEEAIFVPKVSLTRYMTLYLHFLARHPLRLTRLLSLYMSNHLGGMFLFAEPDNLYNSLHPARGIVLARTLAENNVSYMHVYGSTYPSTQAIVASHLLGIPFSLSTFVDFDYDSEFKMLSQKAELATFIVAVTRFCAYRIVSMTSERIRGKLHVIHHGIDQSYGAIESLPSRTDTVQIIGVGRLVEKKGFDYLLRACSLLQGRGVHVKCTIVGGGPEENRLRALIKELQLEDEVTLTGPLPNDEMRDVMASHSIVVAPSVYCRDGERDGIPTVLLEAMSCGIPVISTDISGIPELISNGENGLLVPERDEKALAAAIQRLVLDSDLRERLVKRARETVMRDFNTDKSAMNLWSLIRSAALTE